MKKRTIWIISIIMGVSFSALLFLQGRYFMQMLGMQKELFDLGVRRSLKRVAREMETQSTLTALQEDLNKEIRARMESSEDSARLVKDMHRLVSIPDYLFNSSDSLLGNLPEVPSLSQHSQGILATINLGDAHRQSLQVDAQMRYEIKQRYLYQRDMLDKVIYTILYNSNEIPLGESVNFRMLDQKLKNELETSGIHMTYHYRVVNQAGEVISQCADYDATGEEYAYRQLLMPNNPQSNQGILYVHFPDRADIFWKSAAFLMPAFGFTLILLVTFIIAVAIIFRQKRLSEMKNDFINNMTHELKTPVASISLASQMLNDPSIKHTPEMTNHLATSIRESTKRLQMLIDKVLQTSLLENQRILYKNTELDMNQIAEDVVASFAIKIGSVGGEVDLQLNAEQAMIYGDEMHVTNVLSNLIENAFKYRREDVPLRLTVATSNERNMLCITVADNGIGIKKENHKKIFEKFYRIHTGDQHNVKGFGLGLAYAKGIVTAMHGTIACEGDTGKGIRFIIHLPYIKE